MENGKLRNKRRGNREWEIHKWRTENEKSRNKGGGYSTVKQAKDISGKGYEASRKSKLRRTSAPRVRTKCASCSPQPTALAFIS